MIVYENMWFEEQVDGRKLLLAIRPTVSRPGPDPNKPIYTAISGIGTLRFDYQMMVNRQAIFVASLQEQEPAEDRPLLHQEQLVWSPLLATT